MPSVCGRGESSRHGADHRHARDRASSTTGSPGDNCASARHVFVPQRSHRDCQSRADRLSSRCRESGKSPDARTAAGFPACHARCGVNLPSSTTHASAIHSASSQPETSDQRPLTLNPSPSTTALPLGRVELAYSHAGFPTPRRAQKARFEVAAEQPRQVVVPDDPADGRLGSGESFEDVEESRPSVARGDRGLG